MLDTIIYDEVSLIFCAVENKGMIPRRDYDDYSKYIND